MSDPLSRPRVRSLDTLPAERGRKVYLVSLGCPKNLVDTERHLALLSKNGFTLADTPDEADLLLVNTCSFIDTAKKESVETILELAEWKTGGRLLAVAGCLVDRYPEELREELPEVDLWLDTRGFPQEPRAIASLPSPKPSEGYIPLENLVSGGEPRRVPWAGFDRISLTPKHTSYLKISEGCDHRCTFCSIPSFKGNHRSVELDLLLAEAESLVRNGTKELTLIGQDIVSYGKDLSRDRSLNIATLLKELDSLSGLEWIRLLYTYPTRLSDELLSAYTDLEKTLPYLDLPLQHLSDRVLERMKRGTPYEKIRYHLNRLREAVPGLVVRSTCIVGFPGETEKDFALLKERFEELKVDHLGVFLYSDEEGTEAFEYSDKVPSPQARARFEEMTEWAASYCQRAARDRLNRPMRVLVDSPSLPPGDGFGDFEVSGQWYRGRWYGQAPEIDGVVYVKSDREHQPGDFVEVVLREAAYPDYLAECPDKS